MDKFGVFNLLNSFLNFYSEKYSEKTDLKNGGKTGKNSDLLNSLSSLLSKKESGNTASDGIKAKPKTSEPKTNETKITPLYNPMLAAMKTHERAVKRIRGNIEK